MEIYLIRHTTPKVEKGICYGQSNIPLADSFSADAKKLIKSLPEKIDAVYSSPSNRCYNLAKLIKSKKLLVDNKLLELNFGDWEMKKWDEIDERSLNFWMKDYINVRTPNGENFIDLENRISKFFEEILKKNYKKIAVVTHKGVIMCMVGKALKIKIDDVFKISVDYSSVTKIILNL